MAARCRRGDDRLFFFFGWRLNTQSVRAIELGLFILLGVGLLLIPVTGLAEQILSKLKE